MKGERMLRERERWSPRSSNKDFWEVKKLKKKSAFERKMWCSKTAGDRIHINSSYFCCGVTIYMFLLFLQSGQKNTHLIHLMQFSQCISFFTVYPQGFWGASKCFLGSPTLKLATQPAHGYTRLDPGFKTTAALACFVWQTQKQTNGIFQQINDHS